MVGKAEVDHKWLQLVKGEERQMQLTWHRLSQEEHTKTHWDPSILGR